MVDEADKAPTHVTCIMKALVESGEMILGDGRRVVTGKLNIEFILTAGMFHRRYTGCRLIAESLHYTSILRPSYNFETFSRCLGF